jgi:hypothetical protein
VCPRDDTSSVTHVAVSGVSMADLLFLVIAVAFFALCALLVKGLEKL